MLKLLIGNKAYSSWSLRGWLACRQSGLAFSEEVVSLYSDSWTKRRTMPDFAPSGGKVPILWDGDTAVWDSLAIIDYLDARSGGSKFWPADAAACGFARSLAAEMHAGFTALRRLHPMNVRKTFAAQPVDDAVQSDVDRMTWLWAQAKARYGGDGPFLFGAFGAADIMFAPAITRFSTWSIPMPDAARSYADSITAHPLVLEWISAAQAETWMIDRFEHPQ